VCRVSRLSRRWRSTCQVISLSNGSGDLLQRRIASSGNQHTQTVRRAETCAGHAAGCWCGSVSCLLFLATLLSICLATVCVFISRQWAIGTLVHASSQRTLRMIEYTLWVATSEQTGFDEPTMRPTVNVQSSADCPRHLYGSWVVLVCCVL